MTAPITPDERAAMRALADAATRAPWEASRDDLTDDMNVVHDQEHRVWVAHTGTRGMVGAEPDAEFIAAARTAVPRLLDALDTAEAKARLVETYLRMEREAARRNLERAEKAEAEVARLRERAAPVRPEREEALGEVRAWVSDHASESISRLVLKAYLDDRIEKGETP